jgi:hypothetical protein
MHTTNAYFNNYNLNALPGVKIVNYNTSELPDRILTDNKLARANRSLLTSAEYASKDIQVMGFVGGDNFSEIQLNYDRLKGRVQDFEGLIRVAQGDTDVEYTGTLNGIQKEMVGPNIKFTLTFKCSNPIGRDAVGRALFAPVNITTSTLTLPFTVEGSFIATPRFTFVFTSITGGTNKTVTLLNAATNKGIKVTRNWVSGDILAINSDTFEVVVNGASIDFDGQFPTFYPGGRSLQYIDDFTTRNLTLSSIYTRQYS